MIRIVDGRSTLRLPTKFILDIPAGCTFYAMHDGEHKLHVKATHASVFVIGDQVEFIDTLGQNDSYPFRQFEPVDITITVSAIPKGR